MFSLFRFLSFSILDFYCLYFQVNWTVFELSIIIYLSRWFTQPHTSLNESKYSINMRHTKEEVKLFIYFEMLLIKLFRSDTDKTVNFLYSFRNCLTWSYISFCFSFIISYVYGYIWIYLSGFLLLTLNNNVKRV